MLMLGLDNAGKTTLMHALCAKNGAAAAPRHHDPTCNPSTLPPASASSGLVFLRPRMARGACHADCAELGIGRSRIRAYDLGGHAQGNATKRSVSAEFNNSRAPRPARYLWSDYLSSTGCVVFVVDASDAERLAEAKLELHVRVPHSALRGGEKKSAPRVVFF